MNGGAFANDLNSAMMARKKRRRKRSKSNRQRIKSFLSSSSGAEDQLNESMIESCSSPDYSQHEHELGKEIFFDFSIAPSDPLPPTDTQAPSQPTTNSTSTLITPQQLSEQIDKLRLCLKETGHIIMVPEYPYPSQRLQEKQLKNP